MNKNCITILFLFITFSGFSQFEFSKKGISIAPITNPDGKIPLSSSIKYPSIFDKKDKLLQSVSLLNIIPKGGKSFMEKEQFANSAREYKKTFDKISSEFKLDYIAQNFGAFHSKTKRIKILCRDYDAVDGDEIRILLDDNQVFSCVLVASNTIFYLELLANVSTIDFEAISEGLSSPNTAEFTILDDNDVLIYNGMWSLSEGYRARIKITK